MAVEVRVVHTTQLGPSLRVGSCDRGKVVAIPMASSAACELVVGTVTTGFGIDDEVTAGESVKNDVDQTRASNDSTFEYVSGYGSRNTLWK